MQPVVECRAGVGLVIITLEIPERPVSEFGIQHPPEADLLTIDVGNTSVHIGVVNGGSITTTQSVAPEAIDSLGETLASLWAELETSSARRVVVGSVVPATLQRVREAALRVLEEEALVVGEQIDLPMAVALEQPERVGVDRICCAAAAFESLKQACVVADFGTAITIDLVGDDGMFLGGTISPGLRLSALSLSEHTAALPEVDLHVPDDALGLDTESAIRAGVVYAAVGALREITERYAEKLNKWPVLIASGGDAELIDSQSDIIDRVVPDLCLRGLALAYRLQAAPSDK